MNAPATHTTLLYDDQRHYAAEAGGFLREGLARGHRGLVMAPQQRIDQLRAALGRDADEVRFIEDTTAYAPQWNAYRVLLDFAAEAPGERSCVIAEQQLTGRTAAEVVDYRRLEAAINVVFAEADVDLLCPYDAGALPPHLLAIAQHTHPAVRTEGVLTPSPRFDDPVDVLADLAAVVPPAPAAIALECSSPAHIAEARRLVRARGADAGLDQDAVGDMALAVTEVLTNALVHGAPPVVLHVYPSDGTWVCHVHDAGRGPADPLVGLLPPGEPSDNGYGLWLARQLCAAVDLGSDSSGTHVRLHARAPQHVHATPA